MGRFGLLLALVVCVCAGINEQPAVDSLVSWISSVGGFISDKIAVRSIGGKRGVVALTDIPAGEKLFVIAPDAIITEQRIAAALPQSFRDLIQFESCGDIFPAMEMLSFLAIYRRSHLGILPSEPPHGGKFEFAPYFASVPAECEMPVCQNQNETLTTIDLTYIADSETFSHSNFRIMYQTCADNVWEVMQTVTDKGFDYRYVSREDLTWAYYSADSRAWSTSEGCVPNHPNDDMCCQLLPYADLMNHATGWPEVDGNTYTTDREIKAGEEVFDNYGDFKSPWEIVKQYGFHLPNYDEVNWFAHRVSFSTEPDTPLSHAKTSLLMHLGFQHEYTQLTSERFEDAFQGWNVWYRSKLMYGIDVSDKAVQFLRITQATWDEFFKYLVDEQGNALPAAGSRPLCKRNEIAAYRALLESIEAEITESWTSEITRGTYEQDVALLNSGVLDSRPFRKLVVTERSRHKRIVYDHLSRVQAHFNSLLAAASDKQDL